MFHKMGDTRETLIIPKQIPWAVLAGDALFVYATLD
jgi:hypothetical protein